MVKLRIGLILFLIPILHGCGSSPAFEQSTQPVSSINKIKPGSIVYVALGDSTGVGQGARKGGYVDRLFRKILPQRTGSRLVNLCVSGATTTDVLHEQLDEGIQAGPDLITLGIGINDIGHGLTLSKFAQNYEAILTRLKKDTQAVVIVTNIPDISSGPRIPSEMRRRYQEMIVEFNQKLEEIAASAGAIVFDIYTITHEELPSHPEYFSADGFHPSDAGYELWAEKMWPTLEGVLE